MGGSDQDVIRAMCADQQGNVYVGGTFSGNSDFDPGPGEKLLSSRGVGTWEGFVAKYDAQGQLIWASSIGGGGNDAVFGLAADASGVYVTGYFSGTAYFNQNETTSLDSYGGTQDIYLAKYDANDGSVVFAKGWGGGGADIAYAIAIDENSNIYLAGEFQSTVSFDDASFLGDRSSTNGTSDMFLAKYSSAGAYKWVDKLGSDARDVAQALFYWNGSIWVGGYYASFLYSDPNNLLTGVGCVGLYDGYFGEYDASNGNWLWGGYVRSTNDDIVSSIEIDNNGINIGGYFHGNAQWYGQNGTSLSRNTTGGYDIFIAKYHHYSYQLDWLNTFGSGSDEYLYDMALQGASIYASGSYSSNLDVDPSSGQHLLLNSSATYDAFLAKYASEDGKLIDAGSVNGAQGGDEALTVSVGQGAVYWGGIITGTDVDVDPGDGMVTQSAIGSYDLFLDRLDPVRPVGPEEISFPNVGEDYFEVLFSRPEPVPDGYIFIYKINGDPTGVPVDGVVYYQGDYIGNGRVVYDVPWNYLSFAAYAGVNYHIAVYAYNGSDAGIKYSEVPLTGQLTTLGSHDDNEPPSITDHSPTKTASGVPVTLSATITDESGVSAVYVDYYPVNSKFGDTDGMSIIDTDEYQLAIGSEYNTEQGIEYAIYAEDVYGNTSDPVYKTVVVEHGDTGLPIPYSAGTSQSNYRIISVPLNLAQKSVESVFADDLGPYDKSKYRLFTYGSGSTSELSSSSSIEIGKGYWFIAAESKTVNSGPGTTALVGDNKPFKVPIVSGWNLIGNPYNFDFDWDIVTEAFANEDKSLGTFKTFEGGFSTATRIKKMSGGFVMVQGAGDGQLTIPYYDPNATGRITAPENFQQPLGSEKWAVDIEVKSGSTTNTFAGFGMHPQASELNDIYDDFTLPRFLDYLELNYNKELYGSPFTKDIVPTSAQHIWEFEVDTNLPDDIIELQWSNSYFGDSDLELVLWDVEQQRATNMKAETNYTFGRGQSRSFRVIYGSQEFVNKETVPFRAVFHSASPVPSSGNVTFSFSLPDSGANVETSLVIYNLLGQKIASLLDHNLPAGYQQAVWNIEDGTKPAAGVYISVLKFGETTLQKRLIIK
jgi:hypothetical protein